MTHEDYVKQAIALGAVTMRVFRIKRSIVPLDWMWENFSYHFFNEEDTEICYYIEDLKDMVQMFVFKEPRIWSDEFKRNPAYLYLKL
jgi:hypothetical protein